MDTMSAILMGQLNAGKEMKVFDWDQAARVIRDNMASEASAGLLEDWGYTGGEILSDGKPVPKEESMAYLASTWATPVLRIGDLTIDCYRKQSEVPDWDALTYWPESALEILSGNVR